MSSCLQDMLQTVQTSIGLTTVQITPPENMLPETQLMDYPLMQIYA